MHKCIFFYNFARWNNQNDCYVKRDILHKLEELSSAGILDAKDAKREENLHRLYMYPAMMVPATQSAIVDIIASELGKERWAIDPFMGSGTSLLSCMEYGMNVYGQDINPMAIMVAKAKTNSYDVSKYLEYLEALKITIQNDNNKDVDISFQNLDKWFAAPVQEDFSRIRRAIIAIPEKNFRYFFWITMAEAIRICSNDRTSTFKLHRRAQQELDSRSVDTITCFLTLCESNIKDLDIFAKKLNVRHLLKDKNYIGDIDVQFGNSMRGINTFRKFDMLLSSPPYGDNHTTVTYGQHSYLALQWIDSNDIPMNVDYDYLQSTQAIDRISLGGKLLGNRRNDIDIFLETIPSLKAFYDAVPYDERKKYDKTLSFIMDFDKSIQMIIPSMRCNAFYVWTIGNRNVGGRMIPNDLILKDIMNKYGINLLWQTERKIFNKKQPNKNNFSSTMEKEHILIFHNNE